MSPFAADTATAAAAVGADWDALRGGHLLVTGGTGFIGRWLLATLAHAEAAHALGCAVTVVTRDPATAPARFAGLCDTGHFRFVAGDVRTGTLPPGPFTHIIHAATDASADLNARDPFGMFDTVVAGTRAVLDLAVTCPGVRLLFLSSGAVYGAQPWEVTHTPEDARTGPDPTDPRNTYAEAKRAAELLCAIAGQHHGLHVTTARIFAVLGPLLSLDTHFAAGNFIRDAMARRTIAIQSAGTAVRSYLYAGDLAHWLWVLLLRGRAGACYNMGSPDAVTVADLARATARVLGGPGVEVLGRADAGWNPGRYVPSVATIARDLGLAPTVSLDDAIRRTALHNGWHP